MAYGILKCDTVTFTDAGIDKSVTLSGLVQNPTFSGNVTVTGTLSGVTVTGTTANFTNGNFTNISGGTHTITSGVFAAGSAASPSITFTGDLNTGIYSPGADQVAISTNGTGRLFVDASGRVGVNTSSPTAGLDINNTAFTRGGHKINGYFNLDAGDGVLINIGTSGGANYIQSVNGATPAELTIDANPLVFRGSSFTERMRLDSSGRLGLGTSSPGYAFDCVASSAGVVAARFRGNSSGSNNTQIRFYGASTATDQWAVGNAVATDDATRNFDIYDLVSNANRLRIDSSGRVGIGTTGPSYQLDVVSASTSVAEFSGPANASVEFKGSGFVEGKIQCGGELIVGSTNNYPVAFAVNNTERARIDSSGRLLVGTSSQSGGSLLQVNDNRIRIATAKTPASATDTGVAGEICWDANYVYVCTATNTWKRSAISTW
jgi:hypothetical protein